MSTLPQALTRAGIAALLTYAVIGGATYGLLIAQFNQLSLVAIALLVVAWLTVRWRSRWLWHATPLDGVILLWLAAFATSLIANGEVWRRIAIGLWFMGAYIGLWTAVSDALANRGVTRAMLIDGLLVSGAVVLVMGFVQLRGWVAEWLPLMRDGVADFDLPRIGSTIGNPNAYGGYLLVLIPLLIVRLWGASRRAARIVLGLLTVSAVLQLVLTYSRGAWLAFAVGVLVLGVLLLARAGMLSREQLRVWWGRQQTPTRIVIGLTGVGGLVLVIGVGLFLLASLNQGGRSLDLRTGIYDVALTMFAEKPVTGYGLFTFGRGLARLESTPPAQTHSHAHNLVLHIASELGLIGLTALALTAWVVVRAARRNWATGGAADRLLLAGGAAAVAGTAAHHLTDVTAMQPSIMIVNLLALALAIAPLTPRELRHGRQRWQTVVAGVGSIALIALGMWSSLTAARYADALINATRQDADGRRDYLGAARQLDAVVAADPSLAPYRLQRGFLYGLAASEGDTGAAEQAVSDFEHYVALEPYYTHGWANLAALDWQLGRHDVALAAAERAALLAPEAWQFALLWAAYADAEGRAEQVRRACDLALTAQPDAALLAGVCAAPVTESTDLEVLNLSPEAAVIARVGRGAPGDLEAARRLWEDAPNSGRDRSSSYVIHALLAGAGGDDAGAQTWVSWAGEVERNPQDRAWSEAGRAWVSLQAGDDEAAGDALAAARAALTPGPFDPDFPFGANIVYIQFLRAGHPRQYLPQVGYIEAPPALLRLLDDLERRAGIHDERGQA